MADSPSFIPLQVAHLPMLQRWLEEPHVVQWWGKPPSFLDIETKYRPRIDGREPTHVFLIEYELSPIGLIQWYQWLDYPDHAAKLGVEPHSAGIDLAIGERTYLGRGIGSAAILSFVREVVFADPTVLAVFSDPEEANGRSLGAFRRAGFRILRTVMLPGKNVRRSVVRLGRFVTHEKV